MKQPRQEVVDEITAKLKENYVGDEHEASVLKTAAKYNAWHLMNLPRSKDVLDENLYSVLVEKALMDKLAFDFVSEISRQWLLHAESVPPSVRRWCNAYISGEVSRPKSQGNIKKPQKTWLLAFAAYQVSLKGYSLGKNAASQHENHAYAIVAEAAIHTGLEIFKGTTPDQVRRAYNEHSKDVSYK